MSTRTPAGTRTHAATDATPATTPAATPAPDRGSHLADPAPLGLAAFALTTFVLSMVNSGIVPDTVEPVVFGLALGYGGLAQLLAGMWEFAKGNTFGATAFASYGAFWISFWWLTGHTDLSGAGADAHQGIGTYLIAWAFFTAYMAVAATRVSGAVLAVFVLLAVTFLLLAIGAFETTSGGLDGWTHAGGYVGLATALAAWYASFGGVTAFTHGRSLVPTAPREG